MTEAERQQIVQEALSWVGTPYHHEGQVKGPRGGVDCAQFLNEVFRRVGLIPLLKFPRYSRQWHLNQPDERLLAWMARYGRKIPGPPEPGDVILYKQKLHNHAAIVVRWPELVVHAVQFRGVTLDRGDLLGYTRRPQGWRFYTYRGKG